MDYDFDEENYDIDKAELYDAEIEIEEEIVEDKNEKSLIDMIAKTSSNKKKNMYYDEELVKDLILNKYLPFLEYGINEKGKRVCTDRSKVSKEVEGEIVSNLLLIANAIINKYKFWMFEPVDDLQAEAISAMWKYIPNYVPGKGSTFDLFSIISKRCLLNYTLKNYKHRINSDIDAHFDLETPEITNYNLFFSNLENTFLYVIDRHFLGKKRKKYIELTAILIEYLVKNKRIIGKNDLISAYKEYSYKSSDYKKFIEDLSKYRDEFNN